MNLLFRLLLSDAYRAWAVPLKTQLETVSLEVEQRPARTFAATDQVFVACFRLSVGDHTGQFSLVVPATLFGGALAQDDAISQPQPESVRLSRGHHGADDARQRSAGRVAGWGQMRLGDLMQLAEGQIVKLDHPVERKAVGTLNGTTWFHRTDRQHWRAPGFYAGRNTGLTSGLTNGLSGRGSTLASCSSTCIAA